MVVKHQEIVAGVTRQSANCNSPIPAAHNPPAFQLQRLFHGIGNNFVIFDMQDREGHV